MSFYAYQQFKEIFNTEPLFHNSAWIGQMVSYPLPNNINKDIKSILMDKYRIEIPVSTWKNRLFIRISIQIYNDKNDVDYLMKALKTICYI